MNVVITGGTSGIGAETVKGLAPTFERLFLLARNTEKAASLLAELTQTYPREKFEIIHCDLEDLSSVIAAAERVRLQTKTVNVLINNAGGIFPEASITPDGFETTFQVNHLGHFLLTQHLLPLLLNGTGARVINVSSEAHRAANPKFERLNATEYFSSFPAYANAKLFNILFTKSLQEKYGPQGLRAYSLHPGVVKTNFGGQHGGVFKWLLKMATPFMIDAKTGAKTSIYLATAELKDQWAGSYFRKSRPSSTSRLASSKKLRDDLWEKSAKWVAKFSLEQ
ncbi:hypothetical protein ADIS_3557 [Lunatimonas lonarensis]|uniref:Uncharacterized protein n=1 Tax=Lunatimonas lonarensis TaxID=1232681 RepID=R7ZPL8_9BACT|nr:SDR family NAD(P)-dependent oxidoreductase [Lunatimonas lonarensis]EON75969.1 hypothetical protein ADIS_3557 [Lunatimonas lonarensis]